jgi:hypothetical protein
MIRFEGLGLMRRDMPCRPPNAKFFMRRDMVYTSGKLLKYIYIYAYVKATF